MSIRSAVAAYLGSLVICSAVAWGGPSAPIDVSIRPEEPGPVDVATGIAVDVISRMGEPAKLKVTFDLVRDDGVPIEEPVSAGTGAALRHGEGRRAAWRMPKTLADGFYILRVSIVAVTLEGHSVVTRDVHLSKTSGTLNVVDPSDFWTQAGPYAAARSKGPTTATPNMCPIDGCGGGEPPPPPTRSGTVFGGFRFFNNNGGYCPGSGANARDCFGSRYVNLDFGYSLPLIDGIVEIWRTSDNAVIGRGSTNSGGGFRINWTVDDERTAIPVYFVFRPRQSSGHWEILNANGSVHNMLAGPFTVHNGNIGEIFPDTTFGNSQANADSYMNVYDGARRVWDLFGTSNRLYVYFTNLQIQAFSNTCPTSCAESWNRLVRLSFDAPFAPQARVMHEMGHFASWVANPGNTRRTGAGWPDYCFPNTGTGCGWNYDTPEWRGTGFEEAIATVMADTGLNGQSMHHPHTCYASASPCAANQLDEETSFGANCGVDANNQPLNREPINMVRFLWDAYDSNPDVAYTDSVSVDFAHFPDTLFYYYVGTANHQRDEEFCSDSSYCHRDGRSAEDYAWNASNTYFIPYNISQQLNFNCGDPG